MISFLKNKKGFAASDGLIAVLIIALFAGTISTLMYNIYISNASLKRMSNANLYIVDVFEHAQKINYDDVTEGSLITYFNNKYYSGIKDAHAASTDQETDAKYRVIIDVQNYNETVGNTDKLDLVKQITATVKYKVGNKNQEITMTTVKQRERNNV